MRILANTETRLSKKTKQNKKHVLRQFGKKSQHNLLKPTKNGTEMHFSFFIENAKEVQNTSQFKIIFTKWRLHNAIISESYV